MNGIIGARFLINTPARRRSSTRTTMSSLLFISLLTAVVLLGTVYSVYYDTFQDTSSAGSLAKSGAYFAARKNVFNKLFVKKAWGWTSVSILSLVLTAPNDDRSTSQRWRVVSGLRWVAATSSWFLFTTWFFGDGLLHRLWLMTGAQCVIEDINAGIEGGTPATPLLVPVNHLECYPQLLPASASTTTTSPTSAKWVGGHDVSGHTFLLMLSAYIIYLTLKPCFAHFSGADSISASARNEKAPLQKGASAVHRVAVYSSVALLVLWIWMLLVTCMYFHTPVEKLTGLLTGYMSIFTVSLIN
ncbi:hypothetical protein E3P89_00029 [Wallemia ichthyophaga]|nr:FIT family protein scs3 [Wallemia ichthyophaga EXF-994]TIB26310.1 hypothetical protein E3P89_00029 [Wallemia ichthyophaga]EOR04210.1 FIT family protein scs3 [Wallemia ichthyophaga EXF-994]TIB36277.1 hypothetical protein E3P85_00030 [Wallemia ichthyophaga]TIB39172.1 hypothetical protein E3P86_01242 [Wallemia ichthyophaga]TIB54759.1 hypothetical protein E3P81_00030 [Wallemia ichthyophaga]